MKKKLVVCLIVALLATMFAANAGFAKNGNNGWGNSGYNYGYNYDPYYTYGGTYVGSYQCDYYPYRTYAYYYDAHYGYYYYYDSYYGCYYYTYNLPKSAPTPTPTATPVPTATPAPTATPVPTEKPSSTTGPSNTGKPTEGPSTTTGPSNTGKPDDVPGQEGKEDHNTETHFCLWCGRSTKVSAHVMSEDGQILTVCAECGHTALGDGQTVIDLPDPPEEEWITAYVNRSKVNVTGIWGNGTKKIATLHLGDMVKILSWETDRKGNYWYKIQKDDVIGFLPCGYLSAEVPTRAVNGGKYSINEFNLGW